MYLVATRSPGGLWSFHCLCASANDAKNVELDIASRGGESITVFINREDADDIAHYFVTRYGS